MPVNFLQKQVEQEPERGADGRFGKGKSGNPAGQPGGAAEQCDLDLRGAVRCGSRNIDPARDRPGARRQRHGVAALSAAAVGARRERPVGFRLPPIENPGDIVAAMAAVTAAVADGTLSPADAYALSQSVDTFLRAIDARDFEERLRGWRRRRRRAGNRRLARMAEWLPDMSPEAASTARCCA